MELKSPSTPALTAAREEYAKIMSDTTHPMHAGFHRSDPAVLAHIDNLYTDAVPDHKPVPLATESVSLGPVEPQPGETPDEAEVRQRNEVILAPLKQEWGPHYEQRFAAALVGVRTVFEGQGEMLDHLGERIRMTYGPKGEAAVLKLFAELETIRNGG
jgi:hypothetical protein